jgi:signal transduction histidine kinase
VGRELHDSIAQALAALRYQLIAIEREAANTELADRLEALRLSAGALLEQVRLLSHTVHPQILDDLGLVPALRHLVRTIGVHAPTTLAVTTGTEAELRAISADAAAALYWIAQEAITNANRHASPHSIEVRVGLADGSVVMHVDDDGAGFDPVTAEREGPAMGLFTMRERATLANGTFEIASTPQQGTSIRVRIPVGSASTPAPRSSAQVLQPEIQNAR